MKRVGHSGSNTCGIRARAHDERHRKRAERFFGSRGNLVKRYVERRRRPGLIQPILLYITDHPDHFTRYAREETQRDVFSNWIFICPELPGQRLTDENGCRAASNVGAVEVAPLQDRNMKCARITRSNDRDVNFRLLRHRHNRTAFHRDGLVRSVHAQWNVIDCACCDHSWQSAHAFQDLLEVAHLLHRLGKFRARNCSRHGEYAMWLEAGIHSP